MKQNNEKLVRKQNKYKNMRYIIVQSFYQSTRISYNFYKYQLTSSVTLYYNIIMFH